MTIEFDKYGFDNHHTGANGNPDLSQFNDFNLINEIDDTQNVQFSDAELFERFK